MIGKINQEYIGSTINVLKKKFLNVRFVDVYGGAVKTRKGHRTNKITQLRNYFYYENAFATINYLYFT